MKKEGGILDNLYKWLSGIVTVGEGIGVFLDNPYIRIAAFIVLVFAIVISWIVKGHKINYLTSQKARKLNNWDERYADIKQKLLENELSDIERRDMQQEESRLWQEKNEINKKLYKQEAAIIQENQKRIRVYGAAIAILLIVNMLGPIYAHAKEWIGNLQNEVGQGTEGAGECEGRESVPVEDEVADNLNGEEKDIQEDYDEPEDIGSGATIVYGMTFYLDAPTLEWIPTPEMETAVFYVDQDNKNIQAIVRQHIEDILGQKLQDTYNGYLSQAEECLADDASQMEGDFDDSREMVKHYAAENNYEEWRKNLKHSADLDDIIEKRNKLWESGKRNGTIALLLANNFQDYALEYQNQGKSGYTILSYYIESIIWSELALSYEGTDKTKIFNYIKARYWDMATCQAIPEEYRNNAKAIYLEMGEYEDYIK